MGDPTLANPPRGDRSTERRWPRWRGFLPPWGKGTRNEFYVWSAEDDEVRGVLVRRQGQDVPAQTIVREVTAGDGAALAGHGGTSVVLLPKSQYLTRTLELPRAAAAELRSMVRLEIEATLPAEFGAFEVSYRRLSETPVSVRVEAYVVRRAAVTARLVRLGKAGLRASAVLPSVVAWSRMRAIGENVRLVVIPMGDGAYEVVGRRAEGEVIVRHLLADDVGTLQTGLTECARTMQPTGGDGEEVVGWLGEVPEGMDGRLKHRDVRGEAANVSEENSGLATAGAVLAAGIEAEVLGAANLLPESVVVEAEKERLVRWLAAGTGLLILALLLAGGTLAVGTARLRAQERGLEAEIQQIKSQSEMVGRRLSQMEAVAGAFASHGTFERLVQGLLTASPETGLSYNQVDVSAEGRVRLRGQAQSLALPFVLPQRLEALPAFRDVLLRDAGQTKKGAGSVTEFYIECTLVGDSDDGAS